MTVALLVPVTSRGSHYARPEDTELFRTLLPSFLRTASWDDTARYRFYLGYDRGDPFYDRADTVDATRAAFGAVVGDRPVELRLDVFNGTDHAPSWVYNGLIELAYNDGCDFFYAIGDDVELITPGWPRAFAAALMSNRAAPGLGVAGPLDEKFRRIMTFSFLSRLHWEIFGTWTPRAFPNWGGDNWIMGVYYPHDVFWMRNYRVRNRGGPPRYRGNAEGDKVFSEELARGRKTLSTWLQRRLDRPCSPSTPTAPGSCTPSPAPDPPRTT
jgi:hypothetical protein